MPDDWEDAFSDDDPAAREREARRAEREARRRDRRRAVADKVREERGSEPRAPSAPPAPAAPARTATADRPVPPAAPSRPTGAPPPDILWRRRLLGLALLAAAAGLVAFAAITLADRIGGSDDPAPAEPIGKTFSVTIPEGYDRTQIAAVAKDAGVKGDYLQASKGGQGFDPSKYGASSPDSLEGFLFPATYELKKNSKVGALVSRQLDAFQDRIKRVDMGYAKSKNLTTYDVVIIASMIEREVQVPDERELVAAVIYNRLSQGIPLQIDATVRFATGNFDSPVTESELQSDSPYNTYTHSNLPPGPIGNPGEDALKAAANPAKENYLYYVVKPDTCGEHTFATTEDEFNQAKAAYDEARAANGGNAPTPSDCPS